MVSGLTVKVGDAEQMASAATKIGDDESLRQKLADGALERAKKYFDAKTMVCRSIDFYKMVCK